MPTEPPHPLPPDQMRRFVQDAQAVLDRNWTGRYTIPSPALYPHQWSWDSGFTALAYARYDQDRAETELRSLFAGQWANGMVPQIVFDADSKDYFPGPEEWETGRSPHAPRGVLTSGIIQPPVHATAVWHIHQYARDKMRACRFLEEAYPRLVAWHDYLRHERCPDGDGLLYIRHPWESGQDNSPLWDAARRRTDVPDDAFHRLEAHQSHYIHKKTRPTRQDYAFYLHLVGIFRDEDYDEVRIRERCPFVIEDVLFNALYCRAQEDLARIAHLLGEDPVPFFEAAHRTRIRMNAKLWDERHGLYFSHDRTTRRHIRIQTASGFTPLYAQIPTAKQAARMVASLDSPKFARVSTDSWAVPSYDRESQRFSKSRYWRGPVWININWLLHHGLWAYGYHVHSRLIKNAIIRMPHEHGFYEYFDPVTGQGLGSDHFSWTAALALDLLLDPAWTGSGGQPTHDVR